ncbi:MAG: DUF3015 family protein [Gammaproteobacteria bacterium]|nr:DUF3015 family protein [Gammaproteobacteria bacterium]
MKTDRFNKYKFNATILTAALLLGGCTITDVTSTTSGSVDAVTPDVTLNRFVDVRLASIQKEAAQGEGENLEALADLMGQRDRQAFSSWMHTNYDELFSNLDKPSQLLSRINNQMRIEDRENSQI